MTGEQHLEGEPRRAARRRAATTVGVPVAVLALAGLAAGCSISTSEAQPTGTGPSSAVTSSTDTSASAPVPTSATSSSTWATTTATAVGPAPQPSSVPAPAVSLASVTDNLAAGQACRGIFDTSEQLAAALGYSEAGEAFEAAVRQDAGAVFLSCGILVRGQLVDVVVSDWAGGIADFAETYQVNASNGQIVIGTALQSLADPSRQAQAQSAFVADLARVTP